jgi:CheY-like chemotaxis protein
MSDSMGVLCVSEIATGDMQRVRAASRGLGVEDAAVLDEGAALARLRVQREVVIVDAQHRHARSLLAHLRGDRDLCDLPVFALARGADREDLVRPLSWGADEVLTPGSLSKLEGLLALATRVTPREPAGVATLAFASEGRRRLHAGVLRAQGYRSQFCASADELRFCLDDPSSQVFIAEASVLTSPAVLRALRARDPLRRPWTVVVSDADGEVWRDLCDEGTALVPDSAPISDVLHRALQVRAASCFELRATPRLHHEAVTHYTVGGVTVTGLSFNIARDGLYVRAAAPPARGTALMLELTPPGAHAAVRLEGVVAWSKPFGSRAFAASPPGFGVAIAGGGEAQLLRWRRGYERLRAARDPASARAAA